MFLAENADDDIGNIAEYNCHQRIQIPLIILLFMIAITSIIVQTNLKWNQGYCHLLILFIIPNCNLYSLLSGEDSCYFLLTSIHPTTLYLKNTYDQPSHSITLRIM